MEITVNVVSKQNKKKKKRMTRLTFLTQFKIEFLLPFTGCRKVLRKMPVNVLDISKHYNSKYMFP